MPSANGMQHSDAPTVHLANPPRVQAAAAHVPDALHVWPDEHDPQEVPQTGSTPQRRAPQLGTQDGVAHVPDALHVWLPEHVPQLVPHDDSTPQVRPPHEGSQGVEPVQTPLPLHDRPPEHDPHDLP